MGAVVVRVGRVGKHPHADNLSLTCVNGRTTCFPTGDYKPGDRAVWIEPKTVVNTHVPDFSWLSRSRHHVRVDKKYIRGVPSYGFLTPLTIDRPEGSDVSHHYGIAKRAFRERLPKLNCNRPPFWKRLLRIFGV